MKIDTKGDSRPATIYDIAKELGLSASTVSRALGNNSRISSKTRQRVIKTAQKLNYSRNSFASNLRQGKSATIGVIVPEINHYFFAGVIHGIEAELQKWDYSLLICQSAEQITKEKRGISLFKTNRVEGVIYAASAETTGSDHLDQFLESNVPLVQFDRVLVDLKTTCVVNDNRQGAYEATAHLIEQGYTKIAHLYGPLSLNVYRERKAGYEDALREHGLQLKNYWIREALTDDAGKQVSHELLSLADPPDAFFCAGDYSAYGVFTVAKEKKIEIPKDLGIVGFANEPFTGMLSPQLSSVEQFSENLGRESARLIMEEINETSEIPRSSRVLSYGTKLIIRESSTRVRMETR